MTSVTHNRGQTHVFLGMSGGVDSSAAALVLLREGYQVSGINLQLFDQTQPQQKAKALADAEDAASVAQRLGFPLHILDCSSQFREFVVREFIAEYEAGRTPNPCIVCNRTIKFGVLLEEALAMGADYIASGHYARIEYDDGSGRWLLKRAADRSKDQSYFLAQLTQRQLSHALFPLGNLTKAQARELAEENGLVNARKRDSQDICFVPDGDYASVIAQLTGRTSPEGDFLSVDGQVLGRHKGFIRYTKGQRRGLGISAGEPVYVVDKDPTSLSVTLGPDSALWAQELTAEHMNWISIPSLDKPMAVSVKVRNTQKDASALVEPLPGNRVRVVFDAPQRAITPGQAVVLYDDDIIVGGGIICK